MTYTVVWKPEAERRLAELWLAAADKQALADAANDIDRALRNHGERVGEELTDVYRVVTSSPLRSVFSVRAGDKLVVVIAVWQFEAEADEN